MSSMYHFYTKKEKDNIMLSFKGNITPNRLTFILQVIELKMENLKDSFNIKKKVYNILVECLQNIYHHSLNDDKEKTNKHSALFMLIKEEKGYSILTENVIITKNVELLRNRINKINSMNNKELRIYYKEVLNNGKTSEKGGGGLGLIDIAKKSGKKLAYYFNQIDKEYSFFSLKIKVSL